MVKSIVHVTDTDGFTYTVSCPGVPSGGIDKAYIEQRTAYDVDSIEVKKSVADRVDDLEAALGVGGGGKSGIAHRIDDLESRIEDLESLH